MLWYDSVNRNVLKSNQSPDNKSLSLSGQGSMVYETTILQMPAAEDAIHSRSKNVSHRVNTVWDW